MQRVAGTLRHGDRARTAGGIRGDLQTRALPLRVVGKATEDQRLLLGDRHFEANPIDMPMSLLFGKPPRMHRDVTRASPTPVPLMLEGVDVEEAAGRVLRLPTVANKTFLISIGDRSITGMVARDQMVGPWQVPVADVAVTVADFDGYNGEAMSIGERTPVALLDAAASGRMAVGEALTNLAAAADRQTRRCEAVGQLDGGGRPPGRGCAPVRDGAGGRYGILSGARDRDTGRQGFDVDEDRLAAGRRAREMAAPLSLIISAFAPVSDVRRTLTPQLRTDLGDTDLVLIDLGQGRNRLGGSALGQVIGSSVTAARISSSRKTSRHCSRRCRT